MKTKLKITILSVLALIGLLQPLQVQACASEHDMLHHEMQHGFVLSDDDKFASHLVATGHHSRQTEIIGELVIEDSVENDTYQHRKSLNAPKQVYFLFQAQALDLPSLKVGQVLTGPIVESKIGHYESKNIIIKNAKFKVSKVLLNIQNPFFTEQ
jgi:hypothetical protein